MSCSTTPHQCLTKLRLSISGRCANYFSHVSGQCFVKTALISLVGCSQLLFHSFNLLLQISWKWRHEHDSIFICLGLPLLYFARVPCRICHGPQDREVTHARISFFSISSKLFHVYACLLKIIFAHNTVHRSRCKCKSE